MSLAQRIHPVLIQRIHELVEGVTETNEVKRSLRVYIKHLNTDDIINPNDRSYNPTDKDISNHVYIAKMKLQLSSLDQENAYMNFRPYKEECIGDYEQENTVQLPSNTLLYIHQEKWQHDLLVKYGNIMSLLDAT